MRFLFVFFILSFIAKASVFASCKGLACTHQLSAEGITALKNAATGCNPKNRKCDNPNPGCRAADATCDLPTDFSRIQAHGPQAIDSTKGEIAGNSWITNGTLLRGDCANSGFRFEPGYANQHCATDHMKYFIHTLGRNWASDHKNPEDWLRIGPVAEVGGGKLADGIKHGSHLNGLDVDIFHDPKISTADLYDQAKRIVRSVHRDTPPMYIYVGPGQFDRMCAYAKENGFDPLVFAALDAWAGHDNHFHIRLRCPPKDGAGADCRDYGGRKRRKCIPN